MYTTRFFNTALGRSALISIMAMVALNLVSVNRSVTPDLPLRVAQTTAGELA